MRQLADRLAEDCGENLMDSSYLVSVIIPCYNQGAWVREAVASVLKSTYKEVEVIVVDDGSTDCRVEEELSDQMGSAVRVITQQNAGVCAARNRAIRGARGNFILTLDADDVLQPDFISNAMSIMRSDSSVVQVGGNYCFLSDGRISAAVETFDSGFVQDFIMARNFLPNVYLFRKSVWELVGGFTESLSRLALEDVDFTLKIHVRNLKTYFIKQPAVIYRQHGESRNNHTCKRILAKVNILIRLWRWYVCHPRYALAFLMWNYFGRLVATCSATEGGGRDETTSA